MTRLWIVHRDPRKRAALARLAAAPEDAVLGAPGDPQFDVAAPGEIILLGLAGDWEAELEYAHAVQRRARGAYWILLGETGAQDEALQLFDTLRAEFLAYPPMPDTLRAKIRGARCTPPALALSQRASRQDVVARFSRWFSDLELPELLRTLDPHLADVPILIRGEPGTGRGLLAQYIHWFGGTAAGAFIHVPCARETRAEEVLDALAEAGRSAEMPLAPTLYLEEVERLPVTLQRRIRDWSECAPPAGGACAALARWIATTGDTGSGREPWPALARALSGLSVRLPPLRERPHLIAGVVGETSRAWCEKRRERPRRFGEDALAVMEEYPWPGNLRELEAVVVQTLAAGASDPVRSGDLQCDGRVFSPLGAGEVEALIVRDDLEQLEELTPIEEAERPAPPEPAQPGDARARDEVSEPVVQPPPEPAHRPAALGDSPAQAMSLARLVASLSHEVRNPLATIRSFAGLLPERFDDPEFRSHFAQLVSRDVDHIDALVERLGQLSDLQAPKREAVDVAALLEQLLDEREETIRERRLLVLKELDASRPLAVADREQLGFAFEALIGKSLELVRERGDVYLASRHHEQQPSGAASVRVLVRFHDPEAEGGSPVSADAAFAEHSLELVIAELVIRAQGGDFALTRTEGKETVIVVDLPAQ
jgi:DNA-binding NtrC family response regulator